MSDHFTRTARSKLPPHGPSHNCIGQSRNMGFYPHTLHAVLRLRGQARCKGLSLQTPGPSSKRFLQCMFIAAVGRRWCQVRPQPKGVWQNVMHKQAQGIHSANFFESQVCELCVCYACLLLMHHTIGRNRHASVPRAVQELVSASKSLFPHASSHSHEYTGTL
jgi:hypothetical protein